MNTDIINKVCEYLCVQPSEIIEWIPDAEYNKTNAEIASIDQQIAELEAKKSNYKANNLHNNQRKRTACILLTEIKMRLTIWENFHIILI